MKKSAIVLFTALLSFSVFAQTVQEGVNHLNSQRYQSAKSVFDKLGIKSARVYGMMDNVLILKNKNNNMPDPESVNQLGVYTGGLFPQPKKFTLGIDVQF